MAQLRISTACLAALLLAGAASAQPVSTRVDGAIIHGYVERLASPEWQGRRTLTPGFDRAAEWAAGRFKEWGLKPAGDAGGYFQPVAITGPKSDLAWAAGMPELVIGGRPFSYKEAEFLVDPSSAAATDVTAEAVFVGYGISAPAKGLDEYAGMDVAGKIVIVLRGSPRDAPPEITDFPGDPPAITPPYDAWAEESADRAKIMTAYGKGAAAVVLCDADPAARQAAPWPKAKPAVSPFSRPFLVVAASDPRILRAVLMRDPLESLVGFVDRVNRIRRAVQQKKARSEATGVRVRVKGFDEVALYGESFGRQESRNVLARIDGSDPVLAKQAVVIGAHLDHLGYRRGLVHPGADDNASGSAVVLEVARLLAASPIRPKRTIVFALWCGEEIGHFGSRRFVAAPTGGLSPDRIVSYINMDMVGLGTGIEAAGARDFPAVFAVMMRDQRPEVARVVKPEPTGPGGSDYAPFVDGGIDAVSLDTIGGIGHPDYHDSTDLAARVQPELLAKVGQFVLQAVVNLGNETATTLPVPGRRVTCDAIYFRPFDMGGQAEEGWRTVGGDSPAALEAAVAQAIARLKAGPPLPAKDPEDQPPRLFVGVRASAVSGNVALLRTAAETLGIARLDIDGDEGAWVRGGLTVTGREALASLAEAGMVVNLVRPTPVLLEDVLTTVPRPVLVSGLQAADQAVARQVAAKNGAVALECTADTVAGCAANLHALRAALGGSEHLLVSVREDDPAVAKVASRALYRALAGRGWTRSEIYAVAGLVPGGDPGGNLARFGR